MRHLLHPILLCLATTCLAQKKPFDPAKAEFYKQDFHYVNYDIYKEHIPLDGATVQYILYRKDSLYGFMDKSTKQMIIAPQFNQVFAVYKEGAIVEHGRGYGLVGYDGKFLIPPAFTNLSKEGHLYHGCSYTVDTSLPEMYSGSIASYYFNEHGRFLFQARAHQLRSFTGSDTMAWFRYADTFSVYGRSGRLLKKIGYDKKKLFFEIDNNCLVYFVETEMGIGSYCWYDAKGTLKYRLSRSDRSMESIHRMGADMFAMVNEDGIAFVNALGVYYPYDVSNGMVFPGQGAMFDNWFNSQELLPVQNNRTKHYGYISGRGDLAIPCKYEYAGPFVNGLAPVREASARQIKFIDTHGRDVVPPVIDESNEDRMDLAEQPLAFGDSLCLVYIGHRSYQDRESESLSKYYLGYLDRKGKFAFALPDSIIMAGPFASGLAPAVSKSGSLGFVNKKGETAIPFKYGLAVAGAYPFPEIIIPEFIHGFAYLKAFKGYIGADGFEYFSGKHVADHYNFSH